MREVEVHVVCDFCKQRYPEVEGVTDVPITIQGKAYLVDACQSCEIDHVEPVFGQVKANSRLAEAKRPYSRKTPVQTYRGAPKGSDEKPWKCSAEGCGRYFATFVAQRIHESKEHGLKKRVVTPKVVPSG